MMTSGTPVVSVVIPTFNRARLVGRAIESVLGQSHDDLELIVVSDACTDDTPEVVKGFGDPRIRYLRHERNRGGSAARNTGIRAARGEFVGLLDSDDEWMPTKLEKQLARFKGASDDLGVVYSGCRWVCEATGVCTQETLPTLGGDIHPDVLAGFCLYGGSTALIRTACLRIVGLFDETLPSYQDWDMWIRLSRSWDFGFVPEVLTKYSMHGEQISTNLKARIVGLESILTKHEEDFRQYPSMLCQYLKRLGALHCHDGNPRAARKWFLRALRYGWVRKDVYAHLVMSLVSPSAHRRLLRNRNLAVRTIGGVEVYY